MDGYLDWLLGSKFNIRTLENEPFFFFFLNHLTTLPALMACLSISPPLCPCVHRALEGRGKLACGAEPA